MDIKLYNTLTRQKEVFHPIDKNLVRIYSCGPTVYSIQHMGNFRAAFIVDLMRQVLRTIWNYPVKHVMNITDVWHLTGDNEGDANTWEDRMEKWARNEWITAREVAEKYISMYFVDLEYLNINASMDQDDLSDIYLPRATDNIQEQITMILDMERKWHTYIVEGDGVYMDTSTMPWYGILLSQKHLEWLDSWSRVELKWKRNSTDFALRKFNMTGKKRDMERESPWWVWFPWRHIECSAMAVKYLWEQFDIHTGWMEHIAVHHTNEIAQAECSCSSSPWVAYRVHYQRLMMNGKKISKSDGNVAYLSQAREQWYDGEDVRYFYLQAHYRSFHDFTREWLESAKKTRHNTIKKIASYLMSQWNLGIENLKNWLLSFKPNEFYTKLSVIIADDIDTVRTLAAISSALKQWNFNDMIDILLFDKNILKIWLIDWVLERFESTLVKVPDEVIALAQLRMESKKSKDYVQADEYRNQIRHLWREIKDTWDGYTITSLE